MRNSIVILCMLLLAIPVAHANPYSTDSETGIVYGEDHAFSISAPSEWTLDNFSGTSQGLHAVFYPKGGSWDKSPAVMYANTASKVHGNESIEKLINFDINQFKLNYPKVKIFDSPPLPTSDKRKAIVKGFEYSNYEAVAYIEEENVIAILVLTARTKEEFKKAFPAFEELVSSYFFITIDVQVQGKNVP